MSPEDVRSRLKDVMKSGERFERRHNRQWRVLDDEFVLREAFGMP